MSKLRVLFLALVVLGLMAVPCVAQTLEDCIQATVKVRADDGSTGTGTLYGFGEHRGKRVALIATAAHVAKTRYATAWVGRRQRKVQGVVIWKRRDVDAAVIAVRIDWFRRIPKPIPLYRSRVRLRTGRAIFSIGHPAGGPALYWKGAVRSYGQDGSIVFHPGPEMGRSGSALFVYTANGEARIVGIISQRDERTLTGNTLGRAVPITHLQSNQWKTSSPGWFNVATNCQCPGGNCPIHGSGGSDRRYRSPYRDRTDKRIDGLERSDGTLPLPPPQQIVPQPVQPPVDLSPLSDRLNRLELTVDAQGKDIVTAKVRVDTIVDGFEEVKMEVGEKFPELAKAYEEAKAAALATQEEAKAAVEVADQAKGAAYMAANGAEGAQRNTVIAREDAAKAKKAVGDIEEDLADESEKGFIGRRIAGIKDRLSTTALGKFASARGWSMASLGLTSALGLGLAGVVIYLFLRREGGKAAAGEKTLGQRFAERTSNPIDNMFFDWLAEKQGFVHEKADQFSPTRRLRKRFFTPETEVVDEAIMEEYPEPPTLGLRSAREAVVASGEKLYRRVGSHFEELQ